MAYSITVRASKKQPGKFLAVIQSGRNVRSPIIGHSEYFDNRADAYKDGVRVRDELMAANKAKRTGSDLSEAIRAIVEQLNVFLAELDAEMTRRQKAWVAGRAAAVAEWKETDEAKTMRRADNSKYYRQLHALAGGKTWYNVVVMSEDKRNEFVEKNCEAIRDHRNVLIGRKLAKANVASLANETVQASNSDGFEGTFIAKTATGETKTITINVIGAGGYNIQCYHQRTLVHVR